MAICFGNSWHVRETCQFAKDVAAFLPFANIRHHQTGRLWQLDDHEMQKSVPVENRGALAVFKGRTSFPLTWGLGACSKLHRPLVSATMPPVV
jgi:hypothetical protein